MGRVPANSRLNYLLRAVTSSVLASLTAGISMAVLNYLVEWIRGGAFFRFEDVFQISLGYAIVWLPIGFLGGILYAAYLIFKKNIKVASLPRMASIYVGAGICLLAIGYINYYHLPMLLSLPSLLWNTFLIVCCAMFLFIFLKYMKFLHSWAFFGIHVSLLILIMAASFASGLFYSDQSQSITENASGDRLNVIVLLLDAVRADHLSCYGYERRTTPNIDRLAERGYVFERAYAASSHTKESVASLFTSTYPSTHDVRTLSSTIPKNMVTLPQIFSLMGYQTAHFCTNAMVSEIYGYDRGVRDYFGQKRYVLGNTILINMINRLGKIELPLVRPLSKGVLNMVEGLFIAKELFPMGDPEPLTDGIISWISNNQDSPFFLYAHYMGGHQPYTPPAPYDRLFDPEYSGEPVSEFPYKQGLFLPFVEGEPVSEDNLINMIAQYDGEIFYHDRCLGSLFDFLRKTGLDEKTILVVTSDHGEEFYEHRGWGHGHSLHEETIHVPLIFYLPGIVPQSNRIGHLVSLVDVFPTLLSLSGISTVSSLPYELEGVDLSPFFYGEETAAPRDHVFAEVFQGGSQSARCLSTGRYKVVTAQFAQKRENMVFDLVHDPSENNNIFDLQKQVARSLFDWMVSIVEESENKVYDSRTIDIDDRLKEQLRSLGYIK